jgi:hypothetical protein
MINDFSVFCGALCGYSPTRLPLSDPIKRTRNRSEGGQRIGRVKVGFGVGNKSASIATEMVGFFN